MLLRKVVVGLIVEMDGVVVGGVLLFAVLWLMVNVGGVVVGIVLVFVVVVGLLMVV